MKKIKTPIEMCFVPNPKKPTLINIPYKDWKMASIELKKQFEELDHSILSILAQLWAEEFSKYPEKGREVDEIIKEI
jgi:hypothetical protein